MGLLGESIRRCIICMGCMMVFCAPASCEVYQKPEAFLHEVFGSKIPQPQVLWMTPALRAKAQNILSHPIGFLRTRYWKKATKSAWVLQEIGKTKPITMGVVIDRGVINKIKVLEFRESRGWEIKHDFFTRQFVEARLNDSLQLDRPIDGISGATLSVRAMNKIARLALLFADSRQPQTESAPAPLK